MKKDTPTAKKCDFTMFLCTWGLFFLKTQVNFRETQVGLRKTQVWIPKNIPQPQIDFLGSPGKVSKKKKSLDSTH